MTVPLFQLWSYAAYAPERPSPEEQQLLRTFFELFPDQCIEGPAANCYAEAVRSSAPRWVCAYSCTVGIACAFCTFTYCCCEACVLEGCTPELGLQAEQGLLCFRLPLFCIFRVMFDVLLSSQSTDTARTAALVVYGGEPVPTEGGHAAEAVQVRRVY